MEEGEYEFYAETQNEDNQEHPPVFHDPTTPTVDTTQIRERYNAPLPHSQGSEEQSQSTAFPYDIESLIIEVECYQCLWNTSIRSHHDQNMRMNSWGLISKKFGKPGLLLFYLFDFKYVTKLYLNYSTKAQYYTGRNKTKH